jgi:dihydroneopterin aldolase
VTELAEIQKRPFNRPIMDQIIISDLEVFARVGVPEAERAKPQRLLLTVEMSHDFKTAEASDDLADTINYDAVAKRLVGFGEGRSWKLIEKLAADIATLLLSEFSPKTVSVEVKKFIISQARYVAVRLIRP